MYYEEKNGLSTDGAKEYINYLRQRFQLKSWFNDIVRCLVFSFKDLEKKIKKFQLEKLTLLFKLIFETNVDFFISDLL